MLKTKIAGLDKLIRKKAMDIGVTPHIISGDKGYQKFNVLGLPRAGSNLLASSLRSRRDIITYGELFNERSRKRRDILGMCQDNSEPQRKL